MFFVYILGAIVALIAFILLGKKNGYGGLPGPVSYPLLGSFPSTPFPNVHLMWNFFREWTQKVDYKPWAIYLAKTPMVIICSSEDVEHVLSKQFSNYVKGQTFHEHFLELLGHGIFNVDGDEWRVHRKAASHLFAAKKLRQFQETVFLRDAEALADILKTKATENSDDFEIAPAFFSLTFDSFTSLAFGTSFDCVSSTIRENKQPEFLALFDSALATCTRRFPSPPFVNKANKIFKLAGEAELPATIQKLRNVVDDIARKRLSMDQAALEERGDLLSAYIMYAKKSGNEESMLTDAYMRDVVLNFILAGRDTTAHLLTATFRLLSHHHKVRDKLEAEIDQFVADGKNSSQVGELKYCEAVLMEALRLFPSVPFDQKTAIDDDVLPSGAKIKSGWIVMYNIVDACTNPHVWGDDAHEFDPSRWIEKRGKAFDEEAGRKFQFIFPAFHAGPRLCLGRSMAILEVQTAIFALLKSKIRLDFHEKRETLYDWTIYNLSPTILYPKGVTKCTVSLRD